MLKDKVVVITGGAGLIGQEFIRAVVEQNGIAIIADINEQVGSEVKNKLSKESINKHLSIFKEIGKGKRVFRTWTKLKGTTSKVKQKTKQIVTLNNNVD